MHLAQSRYTYILRSSIPLGHKSSLRSSLLLASMAKATDDVVAVTAANQPDVSQTSSHQSSQSLKPSQVQPPQVQAPQQALWVFDAAAYGKPRVPRPLPLDIFWFAPSSATNPIPGPRVNHPRATKPIPEQYTNPHGDTQPAMPLPTIPAYTNLRELLPQPQNDAAAPGFFKQVNSINQIKLQPSGGSQIPHDFPFLMHQLQKVAKDVKIVKHSSGKLASHHFSDVGRVLMSYRDYKSMHSMTLVNKDFYNMVRDNVAFAIVPRWNDRFLGADDRTSCPDPNSWIQSPALRNNESTVALMQTIRSG